jgi:hypothetical protein
VKKGIQGIVEGNLSSLEKINLENSLETLKTLQSRQIKEELNIFDFFLLEKQSREKLFNAVIPIPNPTLVRE